MWLKLYFLPNSEHSEEMNQVPLSLMRISGKLYLAKVSLMAAIAAADVVDHRLMTSENLEK